MKIVNLKHYALALTKIGREQGIFDQLLADLHNVSEKINDNPDLKKYLLDSHVSLDLKKKALGLVFQDFVSARTINFILLLVKEKKLEYLTQIITLAQKNYLHQEDIKEIFVETVIPLSAEQEKKLIDLMTAKLEVKILMKNLINKDIIGGMVVTVGDQVFDGSIRGKIRNLKKKINSII